MLLPLFFLLWKCQQIGSKASKVPQKYVTIYFQLKYWLKYLFWKRVYYYETISNALQLQHCIRLCFSKILTFNPHCSLIPISLVAQMSFGRDSKPPLQTSCDECKALALCDFEVRFLFHENSHFYLIEIGNLSGNHR